MVPFRFNLLRSLVACGRQQIRTAAARPISPTFRYINSVDIDGAEKASAAQQSEVKGRDALERRSSYYADLASLCGMDKRDDIGKLVKTLKVLTDQENRLREASSSLGAGERARAAAVMQEAGVTEEIVAEEIATLDEVSRHVCGGFRKSVRQGTSAMESRAVVNRASLKETKKKVRLSESTIYRFNLDTAAVNLP